MNQSFLVLKMGLMGVVVSGVMVSTISVAQAFVIGAGDRLQLNGGAGGLSLQYSDLNSPIVDFFGPNANNNTGPLRVSQGSTGAFSSLVGHGGRIKDLYAGDLFAGKTKFLRIFDQQPNDNNPADDLFFDLTTFLDAQESVLNGPLNTLSASFRGIFTNATGAVIGNGLATIQLPDGEYEGDSSWSMTIVAEQVPTPALLPGLIGMGISLVRKRRTQASSTAGV
jgi:hypothetical protein